MASPIFTLGARGQGGLPVQEQGWTLRALPPALPPPQALPKPLGSSRQASSPRGATRRLGTQAWGLGCRQRSWQLREKGASAAAATTQTAGWGGGGGAGSTSTRVAQGSSGSKLSRKETHISHVSLAGPTAGAVMVAPLGGTHLGAPLVKNDLHV